LTTKTAERRNACVIGWPAGHSRSPLIHNYWIRLHGLTGEYRREAVPPEQFAGFVATLAEKGYAGANVTIPHKEAALALASPDARARAIGSANTLWLENGKLLATNTDAEGFLANLDAAAPDWQRATHALILGAGGAARAVAYGLIARGIARIHVVNRTASRAGALRAQLGDAIVPSGWSDVPRLLRDATLLVNTTSLGMHGQPPLEIDLAPLPSGAVVADLVYVPRETPLLAAARRRDLRTADGLGMLLHQAVRGFSLWFGVRPEVTPELRKLVEDDLAKS
jgi:shikimate dehydrogenase